MYSTLRRATDPSKEAMGKLADMEKEHKFCKRKYSTLLRKTDGDKESKEEEAKDVAKELKFCKRKYS
jgi:hypothetical protein